MTTPPPEYEWLDALPPPDGISLSVALGVFDGVHRGHQALLAAAVEAAAQTVSTPAALTFDPHPASVFSPSRVPLLLGTLEQRAEMLREHGARRVIVARFDRVFAARTPDEFVREVLRDRLNARAVIIGEDFRFGCNRAGDAAFLRAAGEQAGFGVHVVAPVFIGGVPARSTGIRQMISGGEVEEAARLLGRPYALRGMVGRGRQLGRVLGFPTANIASEPGIMIPGAGVYAGRLRVGNEDRRHRAAISIGTNPTVAENAPPTVEAFILDDFNRDLYGASVEVTFPFRLRGMEKFDSLEALVQQMGRDVEDTKRRIPLE